MGRGRAKAKQTKVARELKYHSPSWDPSKLQQDLRGSEAPPTRVADSDVEQDGDDEYASYVDPYAEDDDAPPPRRR